MMLSNQNLKKLVVIFSLPIIALVSAIAFSGKGLFYYSEWKDSREVVFDTSKFEGNSLNEFYNKVVNLDGVARIYRQDNKIIFQQISEEQVRQIIKDNSGKDDTSIYQLSYLKNSTKTFNAENIVLLALFLIFSIVGYHFIVTFRKKEDLSLLTIANFYVPFILSSLVGFIIYTGIAGLISRFYLITSVDLLFIPIALMVTGVFLVMNSKLTGQENLKSFASILKSYRRIYSEKEINNIFKIGLVILAFVAIGLGGNFLISAILLVLAIGLQLYSVRWFITTFGTDYRKLFSDVKEIRFSRKAAQMHANERGEIKESSPKKKAKTPAKKKYRRS